MATRTHTLKVTTHYASKLTPEQKAAIDANHAKWLASVKAVAEATSTALHNAGNPSTPATGTTIESAGPAVHAD